MNEENSVEALICIALCTSIIGLGSSIIGQFLAYKFFPVVFLVCAIEHVQDTTLLKSAMHKVLAG